MQDATLQISRSPFSGKKVNFIDHDTIMFREDPFIERLQPRRGNNDGSGEGSMNKNIPYSHFCM